MDAHNHLLFNHLPILGALFSVLLLAGGFLFRSRPVRHAALVSLVITSLVTIPAFNTGEPAEEAVEHLPGISESVIHEHEEAAETAAIVSYVMGAIAAFSLFASLKGKSFAGIASVVSLIAGIAVFAVMANVGNEGGKIRHTELSGTVSTTAGYGTMDNHDHEDHDH